MHIHVQLQLPAERAQTKTSYTGNLFNSWHKCIFGCELIISNRLRTIEAENP